MSGQIQEGLVACRDKSRRGWSHVGTNPGGVGRMSGQLQEGLVACRDKSRRGWSHDKDAGIIPECEAKMCASIGRNEPELVGLPGKALTRDATRRLGFGVHEAVGCSLWRTTVADAEVCCSRQRIGLWIENMLICFGILYCLSINKI